MIEQLSGFPENTAAFVCHGQVTRQDYAATLIPAVEKMLQTHDKIRIYYEVGADFSGIDPAAMWEDTKLGLGHLMRWERMAVVTDVEWMRMAMTAFGFMMPGLIRVFPTAEAEQARAWLAA